MLLIGILQGVKLILLPVPINSIFEEGIIIEDVAGECYDQVGGTLALLKR